LRPSAINSWVGEHGFGGIFGLYGSSDTAGTILAFRGWALYDIASNGNTELPLPVGNGKEYTAVFDKQAPYSWPSV
jgi:hypothetical protein